MWDELAGKVRPRDLLLDPVIYRDLSANHACLRTLYWTLLLMLFGERLPRDIGDTSSTSSCGVLLLGDQPDFWFTGSTGVFWDTSSPPQTCIDERAMNRRLGGSQFLFFSHSVSSVTTFHPPNIQRLHIGSRRKTRRRWWRDVRPLRHDEQ